MSAERVAAVLAEIDRREAAAKQAAEAYGSGVWHVGWWENVSNVDTTTGYTVNDGNGDLIAEVIEEHQAHIAYNDPVHVLAVLRQHKATLERHALVILESSAFCYWRSCWDTDAAWPCPDVRGVFDCYPDTS